MKFFDSFLEIAGNLGFLVGNNDRIRERTRRERRNWGVQQEGFQLSAAITGDEASRKVEVALRNASAEPREIQLQPWLIFFPIAIHEASLTPFGRKQMEAAAATPARTVTLSPNQVLEADIPISALYDLTKPGLYTITVTCQASRALSHSLEIRI